MRDHRAVTHSTFVKLATWVLEYLSTHTVIDRAAELNERVTLAYQRSLRYSRTGALIRMTRQLGANSRIYDWLTAEPEREVIVIDLRDTLFFGPLIRVQERQLDESPVEHSESREVSDSAAVATDSTAMVTDKPAQILALGVFLLSVGILTGLVVSGAQLAVIGVVSVCALVSLLCSRVTVSWATLSTSKTGAFLRFLLTPPETAPTSPNGQKDGTVSSESEYDGTGKSPTRIEK